MKQQLTKAKNQGFRFVYLDETVFSRKTLMNTEWCRQNENMTVDMACLNEPTLALLSGISKERGQEHFKIFHRSVNIDKFKLYLSELRTAIGEEKVEFVFAQIK